MEGMRRFFSGIFPMLKAAGAGLLDLCLPRSCAGCSRLDGKARGLWCETCLERMERIDGPVCPRCGRPFPDAPDSTGHLCGECLQSAFHFDTARSAVIHSDVVRDRINQFKFGGRLEWVPPLVELLEKEYRCGSIPAPDMVVPVPLHPGRLRERGFNQSGLLAGGLGRNLELRVRFDVLARRNWTEPQARLNRRERLENVKGAFAVCCASEHIRDRRILLIDDVYTTGTTLSECARTLKKNGASEVYALTVTRARPD